MTLKLSVRVGIFCICYAMLRRERAFLFSFSLSAIPGIHLISLLEKVLKGLGGGVGEGENKSGVGGGDEVRQEWRKQCFNTNVARRFENSLKRNMG